MKRRLFVPLIFAGLAAASGVASANPNYWRQNGLLLEVSADPRDGTDMVRVDATRANQLQLIATTTVTSSRSTRSPVITVTGPSASGAERLVDRG